MNFNKLKFHNCSCDTDFKNLTFKIEKKKGKIKRFYVFDRILRIPISKKNLVCGLCDSTNCKHVLFLYNQYFKIPKKLLPVIDLLKFEYDFLNYDKDTFIKEIDNVLNDFECCICLNGAERNQELWMCKNCKRLIHLKCVNSWRRKHNNCPLCKEVIYDY